MKEQLRIFRTTSKSPYGEGKLIIVDDNKEVAAWLNCTNYPEEKAENIRRDIETEKMVEVKFTIE